MTYAKRFFFLLVALCFLLAGAIFGWLAFAQGKGAKHLVKQVAIDPTFIGLIMFGILVIVGGIEAAKKYGLIKSPTDKAIARVTVALNILMPEDVPLQDTAFYTIVQSIKKINPDRMDKDLAQLAQFAEIHAQQQRKIIKLLTFIASRVGGEEWKTTSEFFGLKDREE